jgi:hypothetical protein
MAKQFFKDAVFSLNSNDVSGYTSGVGLDHQYASGETTTYGSAGAQEFIPTIESWTMDWVVKQDFAAAAIDSIVWPLHSGRSTVPMTLRANSAVVSSSNPQWSGNVLILNWKPVGGNVGDVAEVSVTLQGTGTLTRATST